MAYVTGLAAWGGQDHAAIQYRQDLLKGNPEIGAPSAPNHELGLVHVLDAPKMQTIVVVHLHPPSDVLGAHRDRLSAGGDLVWRL